MTTKFIDSAEDMQWLRDVHLPKLSARFNSARIKGNEDSPDRITVFEKNNPSIHPDDEGVDFAQNVNGKFDLAFNRVAIMDAYVVLAAYNDKEAFRARLADAPREVLDLSQIGFFRSSRGHGSQWEVIDSLSDAAREHYFALLRKEIGEEEGQKIVTNWERVHTADSVEIKVTNSGDDPFTIQFEVHDVIAEAWADAHGALCGGTWETADGDNFVYDNGAWHPGVFEKLKEEGYNLDLSEWSDPEEEDFKIATHLGECPKCEGTDFAAAKRHVESLRS